MTSLATINLSSTGPELRISICRRQTLAVSDVPQVGAAVTVAGGEVAVWPECDRVDALGCGSVSVAMSLPVVVRVLAGWSWETAAGAAGDRGHAPGAEDGCMRGVGCCWLSSSGAIRAR